MLTAGAFTYGLWRCRQYVPTESLRRQPRSAAGTTPPHAPAAQTRFSLFTFHFPLPTPTKESPSPPRNQI